MLGFSGFGCATGAWTCFLGGIFCYSRDISKYPHGACSNGNSQGCKKVVIVAQGSGGIERKPFNGARYRELHCPARTNRRAAER